MLGEQLQAAITMLTATVNATLNTISQLESRLEDQSQTVHELREHIKSLPQLEKSDAGKEA